MSNVFHADWYRLRKSASFRNIMIGLFALIVFLGVTIKLSEPLMMSVGSSEMLGEYMSGEEKQEVQLAIQELDEIIPGKATDFTNEVLESNVILFFLLPVIVSVFAADFSSSAIRNTLSFESDRGKVYLAKLALSMAACIMLNIFQLVASWIVGGVIFGFGGFSAGYFLQILLFLLLMLPVQFGVVGFGHCVVACTKKSSSTIAAYLLVLIFSSVVIQLLGMLPPLRWVTYLDWNSAGRFLMNPQSTGMPGVVIIVLGGLAFGAVTTLVGKTRFENTDID